jgi:hypothetical protein
MKCAPPTHAAFDIDVYDCPCGHMYGDHDYGRRKPGGTMVIDHCTVCRDEVARVVWPNVWQPCPHCECISMKLWGSYSWDAVFECNACLAVVSLNDYLGER